MNFFLVLLTELQESTLLVWRALRYPFRRPVYWRETVAQMDSIGFGTLPIVLLAGFFIGAVLALQTAGTLRSFGAQNYTGRLVATSLLRELGPVLTCILLAGRAGSGIAAELGAMCVSEQIDAMRALGTDPFRKLVRPRLLALLTMAPILTVFANVVGIIGGLIVAITLLQIPSSVYLSSAREALNYDDIWGTFLKTGVFGLIVAVVGCRCGLRTRGGTVGVGQSTTTSVVVSIVLILVSDFFLTRLILTLSGMA
ncbi:MAG: ABC transporter permease [Chloracidobacterium sp.]|uniref:ABC transporter permease n=1 Tax=Chloracidobacterium validum TaxID=2821543 RepID=A0ABX8B895_9BACT|nr:ABC transporter permease [Chloracidobacterium validum]QUW03157.1 ABC transporter permease [Chloracidobacterium validum]